jgi:AhpD family alkylhydroperoxidase
MLKGRGREPRMQSRAPRMSFAKVLPDVHKALLAVKAAIASTGLDPSLMELVRIRASQINGCAFCLSLHTKDARIAGESELRLYTLSAWRETPFFTRREQAALALTEAMTVLHDGGVSDEIYEQAAAQFERVELAALIATIAMINALNRVAVSTHMVPIGAHPPQKLAAMPHGAAR